MSSSASADDEAFSLAEVLVGLMLTAILLAALAALGGQFKVLLGSTDRISRHMELNSVARKIAQTIEQAERLPIAHDSAGQSVFLAGTTEEIAFVASLRLGFRTSGLRDLKIWLDDEGKVVIDAGFRRSNQTWVTPRAPNRLELTGGPVSIRFRYLDKGAGADPLKWLPQWDRPGSLPLGVSVELTEVNPLGQTIEASAFAAMSM